MYAEEAATQDLDLFESFILPVVKTYHGRKVHALSKSFDCG
jgi:hypothetical protein